MRSTQLESDLPRGAILNSRSSMASALRMDHDFRIASLGESQPVSLLGHAKPESTVEYLGMEVEGVFVTEQVDL